MKSIRKDGGNEEDWTVEGFGKAKTTSTGDQKPSVRFTGQDSVSVPSEAEYNDEPSETEYKYNGKQLSSTEGGKERAR